jgi:hypothetical protein
VKAAAPQAPGSSHTAAKTSAKGLTKSAKSADAAVFARVLAKTVAAKGAASGQAAGRIPVDAATAQSAKTAAALAKSPSRDTARAARQRRADEAPAADRTVAEAQVGRFAAASLPRAPATADSRTTGPAVTGRRADPRVQVVDLRKKAAAADAPDAAPSHAKARAGNAEGAVSAVKPFTERLASAEAPQKAAAPARATPLDRIREMTGSDLARTVGLVVRDGGGEIRLTLKPESLGSVRIRLSLEDGTVEGRIIVDTPEARQAFEAGLDGLTRALHADGFQTGSLQVFVSGQNANDSRQAAGLLGDSISAARLRASDETSPAAVPPVGWDGGGDGLVDVFA